MGLLKKPPLGALCLKGPVRCSGTLPKENPEAALADSVRLRVWICSGMKVVVVMWVFLKSLICSSAWRVGKVSMSSGVKSIDEVENCLWGLSSSVQRLFTRLWRCSRSISLSSWGMRKTRGTTHHRHLCWAEVSQGDQHCSGSTRHNWLELALGWRCPECHQQAPHCLKPGGQSQTEADPYTTATFKPWIQTTKLKAPLVEFQEKARSELGGLD